MKPNGLVKLVITLGVPLFLLLWVLGAFDRFMPSPVTAAVQKHEESNSRALRLICRGTWRGDEAAQRECDR